MKKAAKPRVQIFVLTAEEKRVVAFVLCAFVLGLATMRYRETHPHPRPPEQQRVDKGANARLRPTEPREEKPPKRRSRRSRPSPSVTPPEDEDDS